MRKALAICSMLAATGAGMLAPSARADHSCDALGEPGWSTVPSHEIVNVADGESIATAAATSIAQIGSALHIPHPSRPPTTP